jgi:hypothetical protein
MASTRKSSKKARKAASSSKAAGTNKAMGASAAGVATSSDVTHPPVIITDGSATIALDENEYPRVPAGGSKHVSTDLRLLSVGANRLHDPDPETGIKSPTCYELDEDEVVEIKVTCLTGGGAHEQSFTITGGNSDDGSGSPVIEFDHHSGHFPPGTVVAGRKRFRSASRKIVSLEIFSPPGSQDPVHTCSVVAKQKGYEISIFDEHL